MSNENQDAKKAYKGFDKDLKCRGFQYDIGGSYKLPDGEKVKVCERGFHAIGADDCPLSVFEYYPPCDDKGIPNRYCEVEVGGDKEKRDGKIVGSEIKIGAEIGIPGIVKAHIEWVKRHLIDDDEHKSSNTGDRSSASNTGYQSSASNTGDQSSASNTGDRSSASNTGDRSSASNTGYQSSASNTGDRSSASNTGDQSSASNTGYRSSASNTGYQSSASNTGDQSSAEVSGKDSVAIATGYDSKAKGALGCAIVVAERGEWNGKTYPLIGICAAIVDGVTIKADTWYTVRNGEFVEVNE